MSTVTNEQRGTMPTRTQEDLRKIVFNLPNQLTWLRLALTIVMLGFIGVGNYLVGMVLFLIAASTDWLDGYFARKYNLVTTLGRILDPFADKVIICGTFIYLASIPRSGVWPWMVVVVVGRELLVTALRSFLEQQGADFSATLSGKLKMVLQCAAATFSLFCLWKYPQSYPTSAAWVGWALDITVWSAVILTVASGVAYIRTAINLLRR